MLTTVYLKYAFSRPELVSRSANQATVNAPGSYSVRVKSTNGCRAMAQATVSGATDAPTAPTLAAAPATTTSGQPITVIASGCMGGSVTWTALGGTGQASGNTYTLAQPGNYTLSATCSSHSFHHAVEELFLLYQLINQSF